MKDAIFHGDFVKAVEQLQKIILVIFYPYSLPQEPTPISKG